MHCNECIYWDANRFRGGRAPCVVSPPVLVVSNDPAIASIGNWPRTLPLEWCGAFKAGSNQAVAVRIISQEVVG